MTEPFFLFMTKPPTNNPYMVNIILAGYDKEMCPSLYFVDYIASLHKLEKAAFGYGSYFALSMMYRHYRSDMTVEEAVDLVDKVIMEIRLRLVVAPPNFVIKIVDKDGVREYAWCESIKDASVVASGGLFKLVTSF
ncbi:Proteasome subunit beta type-2-A [Forsythia ovata]|uniref:Proteasome subunit beta type-2-A n=1 Tax=Forsythia ovata TaxID=205694 RepID=A0ABD1UZL2_9LAMI